MISINSSYTKGQRSKKSKVDTKQKNALTRFDGCDIILQWYFEVWLSLVERCVRDAEVVGSNPVASTGMKMPKALTIKSFGIFSYVRKRTGKQGKISGHEFSHEFFRPIGKEYTRRKFL